MLVVRVSRLPAPRPPKTCVAAAAAEGGAHAPAAPLLEQHDEDEDGAHQDVQRLEQKKEHVVGAGVQEETTSDSAARAIAPNEAASKLAPPTRAPSTLAAARRAFALSAFTEPP